MQLSDKVKVTLPDGTVAATPPLNDLLAALWYQTFFGNKDYGPALAPGLGEVTDALAGQQQAIDALTVKADLILQRLGEPV